MIEFKGEFSPQTEKFYFNNSRKAARNLMLFAVIIWLPIVLSYYLYSFDIKVILYYLLILIVAPLYMCVIPLSKKEKKRQMPQKIYTDEDECINVVLGDGRKESCCISDVKCVYDYDDFYYLVFVFGKKNWKFVCQKSLITQGNLEEFESLFDVEIVKKKHFSWFL